jgi:hypothetical protein
MEHHFSIKAITIYFLSLLRLMAALLELFWKTMGSCRLKVITIGTYYGLARV